MLAAQGMKAVANLFQPDTRETETLDNPEPPAAPGRGSGYPRKDAQGAAGSRTLALDDSIHPNAASSNRF